MDKKKDYHQILNIKQKASEKKIKRSFYKLAKQCHPDISKDFKKQKKLKKITSIYTIFADSSWRRKYGQYIKGKMSFSFLELENWLQTNFLNNNFCLICYFQNDETKRNNCHKKFHLYETCCWCQKKLDIRKLKYFFGPYKEIKKMIFFCQYYHFTKFERKIFAKATIKEVDTQMMWKNFWTYINGIILAIIVKVGLIATGNFKTWWGICLLIVCIIALLFLPFLVWGIKINIDEERKKQLKY